MFTMKLFVAALLLLAGIVSAENVEHMIPGNSAYGYLKNIGIPQAERIRQAERDLQSQKIIGGVPAALGQFEYQVGLLISIVGLNGHGVCGGSLISPNRVLTAAHCWFDGLNQAWSFEVVLGPVLLYSGGYVVQTSDIAVHPNWFPLLARNDIGVIYLPYNVPLSNYIGPVRLPSGSELNEDFVDENVIASGFGITEMGGSISGGLNHVSLTVISNSVCRVAFPLFLQDSNICTSGMQGGTCSGDSGGPLVATRNEERILIGVTSFGSGIGSACESIMPAAYARINSFIEFINLHNTT